MTNIDKLRSFFPTLTSKRIYFDNAASALTPNSVIKKVIEYYKKYSCNLYRGEYMSSSQLEKEVESIRSLNASFINAKSNKEIIFTSGSTASSNIIIQMLLSKFSHGDEVVLTNHAHSSLFAPIFNISRKKNINIQFLPLKKDYSLDFEKLIKSNIFNPNTKVVFISHLTNVYGISFPIKKISEYLKKKCNNALLVVDAAQSISHLPINVKEMNCDFLFYSAHKAFGPTGVGILYGKEVHLNRFKPPILGGGQITHVSSYDSFVLKEPPYKFEAGTLPIASILGLGEAIRFINRLGLTWIHKRLNKLNNYLINELKKVKLVILHSQKYMTNVVFSVKGFAIHDVVAHLDANDISVRGGQHCAQLLTFLTNHPKQTIRVSLQIYNTFEEIDKFIKVLIDGEKRHFLDGFI